MTELLSQNVNSPPMNLSYDNEPESTKVTSEQTANSQNGMSNILTSPRLTRVLPYLMILRDTEASQSLMFKDVLPLEQLFTGNNVLIQGVESGVVSVPFRVDKLRTQLVFGPVMVGVMTFLLAKGILENDLPLKSQLPAIEEYDKDLLSFCQGFEDYQSAAPYVFGSIF